MVVKTIKMADYYEKIFQVILIKRAMIFRSLIKIKYPSPLRFLTTRAISLRSFVKQMTFLRFDIWKDEAFGNPEKFSINIQQGARHLDQSVISYLSSAYHEEFTPEKLLPPPVFDAKIKLKKKSRIGDTFAERLVDF